MKLAEIAFACHIYGPMTEYDRSYQQFLNITKPQLDLSQEQHCLALLKWLNDWGCRQFAIEYHKMAAEQLRTWFQDKVYRLVPCDLNLLDFTDDDFNSVTFAYAELVSMKACQRITRNGSLSTIEFGPTGTAKILFALRPNSLIPWDIPMRSKFKYDGSAEDYMDYLKFVRENLEELNNACIARGYSLTELPHLLGRPKSSLTKLIDEYFWVTVSRNCPAPSRQELNQWALWW